MIIETDLDINNSNVRQMVIHGYHILYIPKGRLGVGALLVDMVGGGGVGQGHPQMCPSS